MTSTENVVLPASDHKAVAATARTALWDTPSGDIAEVLLHLEALALRLKSKLLSPPQEQPDDALLTVAQVAKRLQMSEYRVYELTRQGQLKCCRLGKSVRVRVSDVSAYVKGAA